MRAAAIRPFSLLDYYLTSIRAGLGALHGPYAREAAARVVNPLSYPRLMEYQLVFQHLESIEGCRVLDVGSPKLPILLLARHAHCELYSTDIRDYFIGPTAEFLVRLGLGDRLGQDIHLEAQDARQLSYPDASFDRVFSISVLEHIPGDGDAAAMREIARVLRPGGIVALTVPFAASGVCEEYLPGAVFGHRDLSGRTFYQRRYDLTALRTRLIEPSGLELVDSAFFGEPGIRFERYWNRIPMGWKVPLLWAQPLLAKLFLKQLGADQQAAACGVALELRKPRRSDAAGPADDASLPTDRAGQGTTVTVAALSFQE